MSSADALRCVLARLAPAWVNPPVLQPAALYLELSGEDIRRRAFMLEDAAAGDLCLRPDMTVPAVRAAFESKTPPAIVAYEGLVFRQQQQGSQRENEFVQIGAEWIGRGPVKPDAEAEIIALALEACAAAKVAPRLRLGDVAIRAAFVDACGLDAAWAARTLNALERPDGLDALAAEIARGASEEGAGLAEALANLPADHAEAALADILSLADITAIRGRPIAEIAERLRLRGKLMAAAPPSAAQKDVLRALIAINAKDGAEQAMKLAKSPALKDGARAQKAVEAAIARRDALAKRTSLPADTSFAPGLGRAVAYYDGFVFELEAPKLGARASLGGGGRYDGLARTLWPHGEAGDLRAAGFALRPARLDEAAA